jgi:hypothetical protein
VYLNWRTNADAPDPVEVQDVMFLYFARLVEGVITFVEDSRSSTGILKVLYMDSSGLLASLVEPISSGNKYFSTKGM